MAKRTIPERFNKIAVIKEKGIEDKRPSEVKLDQTEAEILHNFKLRLENTVLTPRPSRR